MEKGFSSSAKSVFDQDENQRMLMVQHQKMLVHYLLSPTMAANVMGAQSNNIYNQKQTQSIILVQNGQKDPQIYGNASTMSSDSSQGPKPRTNQKDTPLYRQLPEEIKLSQEGKRQNVQKKKKKFETEEEYAPEGVEPYDYPEPRISQSKNIPKIFGKGILTFIDMNRTFTLRVLDHLGFPEEEFYKSVSYFNDNLSSIADLRTFWLDEGNQHAKAFRILSKQYLRKHSLPYIFNSKITTLAKHIKYRKKIQKSIGQPEHFTNMKDY